MASCSASSPSLEQVVLKTSTVDSARTVLPHELPIACGTRFDELLQLLSQAHQEEVRHWESQVRARTSTVGSLNSEVLATASDEYERSLSSTTAGKSHKTQKSTFLSAVAENSPSPESRTTHCSVHHYPSTNPSHRSEMSFAETTHGSVPTWLFEDVQKQVTRRTNGTAMMFAEACGVHHSIFAGGTFSSKGHIKSMPMAQLYAPHAAAFVGSSRFDVICTIAIILDGVMIGWRTHEDAMSPSMSSRAHFQITDKLFSLWFLSELCIRYLFEGSLVVFFCTGTKARWNLFDLILIMSDVIELIFEIIVGRSPEEMSNFSVMRMLRILRICRALRILRLFSFFKELRMMVLSLMLSGRSLFWSMIMLSIIIYLFSVYFIQVTTQHMVNGWDDSQLHRDLKTYCNGLPVLAYYLFQSMSGGMNWGALGNLLIRADWSNGPAMIFFIFFTIFAVLNIITGIFVDTALNTAMEDKEEVIHEYLSAHDSTLRRLKEVFETADVDSSGFLTYSQFVRMMNDKEIRALLASIGLTATKVSGLFKLMDLDNSGEVSLDEFLLQCMRLKGAAKSVDLMSLMYENKKMMNSFHELTRFIKAESARSKGMQEVIFTDLQMLRLQGAIPSRNKASSMGATLVLKRNDSNSSDTGVWSNGFGEMNSHCVEPPKQNNPGPAIIIQSADDLITQSRRSVYV